MVDQRKSDQARRQLRDRTGKFRDENKQKFADQAMLTKYAEQAPVLWSDDLSTVDARLASMNPNRLDKVPLYVAYDDGHSSIRRLEWKNNTLYDGETPVAQLKHNKLQVSSSVTAFRPPKDEELVADLEDRIDIGEPLTEDDTRMISRLDNPNHIARIMARANVEADCALATNQYLPEPMLNELVSQHTNTDEQATVRQAICSRIKPSADLVAECESWATNPSVERSTKRRAQYAAALAQNETIPSDTLIRIMRANPTSEQAALTVKNRNANDTAIAFAVAHTRNPETISDALQNPNHDYMTVEMAIGRGDPYNQQDAFADPKIDPFTLKDWQEHCSYNNNQAALGAASNPILDEKTAVALHEYGNPDVDRNLALNPRTPKTVLNDLVQSKNRMVSLTLASNPNLSTEQCQKIHDAYSYDIELLAVLRNNPATRQAVER